MNKVSLVKMATFVDATKELQLTTIPNIQLLDSAIIVLRQPTILTGLNLLQYFAKR